MAKAPPAFQFYPDAFEAGTSTFTLSEVGAYVRLLNHQWAHGSVPGNDIRALSRIMRCTVPTAKSAWRTIGEKFPVTDGRHRNDRLELERKKQLERRAALAESGKKGGAAKAALQHTPQQMPQPSPGLSSSSLEDQVSITRSDPKSAVPVPIRPAARPLVRPRRGDAAFEHPRFFVPQVWHDARVDGMAKGEFDMSDFYKHLAAHVEAHPEEDTEPRFEWLTEHFNAWVKARKKPAPSSSDVPDVEETKRRWLSTR